MFNFAVVDVLSSLAPILLNIPGSNNFESLNKDDFPVINACKHALLMRWFLSPRRKQPSQCSHPFVTIFISLIHITCVFVFGPIK